MSEGDTCLDCIELKTCNQEPLNSGAAPPQTFCKTKIKSKCNNIKRYFQLDVCCAMLETPLQPSLFPTKSSQFLGVIVFFSPIYRCIMTSNASYQHLMYHFFNLCDVFNYIRLCVTLYLQSSGYKNNLLKERGAAKDCNMGELCSASEHMQRPGRCLIDGSPSSAEQSWTRRCGSEKERCCWQVQSEY